MVPTVDEKDFETIAEQISINTENRFSIGVELELDNPYVILKTEKPFPVTREEVLSKLRVNLDDVMSDEYTISITNAEKNDKFEYTVRIKPMTNPLGARQST